MLYFFQLGQILLLLITCSVVQAQTDPYEYINDPESIIRWEPTRVANTKAVHRILPPPELDPENGYHILASDSGRGVVSRIWMAFGGPDTATELQLWIDGVLIARDKIFSFLGGKNPELPPPFDTSISAGLTNYIQIPFRKSFKLLYKPVPALVFYAVDWKLVDDSVMVPEWGSGELEDFASQAASAYWDKQRSHLSENQVSQTQSVSPSKDLIQAISGPGIIRRLSIRLEDNDRALLDSLELVIRYDHSSNNDVLISLGDFFLVTPEVRPYSSFYQEITAEQEFISRFPIPFERAVDIVIRNRSRRDVKCSLRVDFNHKSIQRNTTLYFFADINVTNPTRYGVYHPLLKLTGSGRYLGTHLRIPNLPHPVSLEGDVQFRIDSDWPYSFRYTGTEDYFDGAWYFGDGPFNLPFAGLLERYTSIYKYHVFDPYDFHDSIEVLLQHGANNDVKNHYRTVSFYYALPSEMENQVDTVFIGSTWHAELVGLPSTNSAVLYIGETAIADLRPDEYGRIDTTLSIPQTSRTGLQSIYFGSTRLKSKILVLDSPKLFLLNDTLPIWRRPGDTIAVRGIGFSSAEEVKVYLGDSLLGKTLSTADGAFAFVSSIGFKRAGVYPISTLSKAGLILASDSVHVTNDFRFEFEDLAASSIWKGGVEWHESVSWFWHSRWSHQAISYFGPHESEASISYSLDLPFAGRYALDIGITQGARFGNYDIYINGVKADSTVTGFALQTFDQQPATIADVAIGAFDAGTYDITFLLRGKDLEAGDSLLGADFIEFRSLDTLTSTVSRDSLPASSILNIFPNPAANEIRLELDGGVGEASVTIVDMLGNEVLRTTTRDRIDVSGLISGTYYLRVSANGAVQTRRVIIER